MFLYMTAHNIHVSFSRLWFFQPVLRRDVVGKPPRSPVMSRRSCGSPVRGQNVSPSHRVGSMCTLCGNGTFDSREIQFSLFSKYPCTTHNVIHCIWPGNSLFWVQFFPFLLLQLDIMILGMIHYGIHLCQRMATWCFRTQYHSISTIWRNAESVNKGYS